VLKEKRAVTARRIPAYDNQGEQQKDENADIDEPDELPFYVPCHIFYSTPKKGGSVTGDFSQEK
jgi:hypothetical protein